MAWINWGFQKMDEDPIREDDIYADVQDTERCDACRCYFIPDALLVSDNGVRLCWDCINLELQAAEQTRAEVLQLEYQGEEGQVIG